MVKGALCSFGKYVLISRERNLLPDFSFFKPQQTRPLFSRQQIDLEGQHSLIFGGPRHLYSFKQCSVDHISSEKNFDVTHGLHYIGLFLK